MKSIKTVLIAAFIVSLSLQFNVYAGDLTAPYPGAVCEISSPYANDPMLKFKFEFTATDFVFDQTCIYAASETYYVTLKEDVSLLDDIIFAFENNLISIAKTNSGGNVSFILELTEMDAFLKLIEEKSRNFQEWKAVKSPEKEKKIPSHDWNISHAGADTTSSGQVLKK